MVSFAWCENIDNIRAKNDFKNATNIILVKFNGEKENEINQLEII